MLQQMQNQVVHQLINNNKKDRDKHQQKEKDKDKKEINKVVLQTKEIQKVSKKNEIII